MSRNETASRPVQSDDRVGASRRTATQLIERVFETNEIAREYPLVFDANFDGDLIEVETEGEVRATCAILVRDLVVGPTKIRVGLIGSVATDARSRGRGLGTEVLEAAEKELRKRGALIAMLWADDLAFYAKRGWCAFGAEHDFAVPVECVDQLPRTQNARPATSADSASIHALYSCHDARVLRTHDETRALLGVPGMRVLVDECNGDVVAYACLNRGRDLTDVVHEWGGPVEDVLALVRAHLETRVANGEAKPLYVMAPLSSTALVERLRALGAPHAVGVLAIGKIVDLPACAELAASSFEPAGYVSAKLHPAREAAVDLCGPHGSCSLASVDLLELLCAARGDTTLVDACARALGVGRGRLPLSPFVWGLDSI